MNPAQTAPVPLLEVWRGGRLESVHWGSIAVCDLKGKLIYARGNPQTATYLRSSAKPFQAIASVQLGTADHFQFTEAEVAMMCASHGGQVEHTSTVQAMAKKCGATLDLLQCGPHPPYHEPTAEAMIRRSEAPARVHNNCSGKHMGMIATCLKQGWPVEKYRDPNHPLQQAIHTTMAAYADHAGDIPYAVDGCGVPTFYLTLAAAATAYARLASSKAHPAEYEAAGPRVAKAVRTHPLLIGHDGQFGTILLEKLGQHIVAKSGAEGMFCVGLIDKGLGLAVKITDGGQRAVGPVVVKLLEQFLHEVSVAEVAKAVIKPILNTRQEPVGEIKVVNL